MAHQSLYRTYRPQVFGDVVGQSHVTRTLRNAVAEGSVAHAYLFSGPRGTGKTTTARILAKALDCEKGPTPDPDNTCESCREITEGRHPDVYELDAASRTGVDALRDEVISKVNYAATRGGYKVYIIDEVHMLSTSAFNALLKTLEEPPPKTVFVLCTTHPHKVPETILSRCQRFDFRRIGTDDIVGRLQFIADEEKITVEPGTLALIARHAAGGMRDAIGTLDQLASFTGGAIAVADVEGLLGEVDTARLFEVVGLLADRDVAGLFAFVADLVETGHDISEFVRALTGHVRDLFVLSATTEIDGIVDVTEADAARLRSQAERFDLDRLARVLDELGRVGSELRRAPDARLALEVSLARIARPVSDLTLESLAERVSALEAGMPASVPAPAREAAHAVKKPAPAAVAHTVAAAPPANAPVGEVVVAAAPIPTAEERPPATPATPAAAAPAPPASDEPDVEVEAAASVPRTRKAPNAQFDVAELRRSWKDVLREVKAARPATSKMFLNTMADVDGDAVVVEFAPDERVFKQMAEEAAVTALLRDSIAKVLGWHVSIRYQLGRGEVRPDTSGDGGSYAPPPPSGTAGDPSELERMLTEGLGAAVVGESGNDQGKDA
jgi:DNA polymerase-3 subunit gamma/tau